MAYRYTYQVIFGDTDAVNTPGTWTLVDGGHSAADVSCDGHMTVRLRSDLRLGVEGTRVRARHTLEAGDTAYCALSWAEQLAVPENYDDAAARIARTIRFWRTWLSRARIPDIDWAAGTVHLRRTPTDRPDHALR